MRVLIEVEVEEVNEVARFVESMRRRRQASATASSDEDYAALVPKQGAWTQSEVDTLATNLDLAAVAHLLDLCASRDGWVRKHEAEGEGPGEFNRYTLRAELSGFSKRLASGDLLGTPRDYWPMEWRKRDRVYEYRLPAEIARWWELARRNDRD